MKIYLKEITIGDVTNGYVDNSEDGVYGYGGLLDIRPKYQREFCYDTKKRNAVIDTIMKGYPLNAMYWCKTPTVPLNFSTGSNVPFRFVSS